MKLWSLLTLTTSLIVSAMLVGCTGVSKDKEGDKPKDAAEPSQTEEAAPPVDVSFLLSMDYKEARTLSASSMEFPPFYKVAADTIEVTKTNPDGTPRRLRAKGRVFIEMNYLEPAKALCQELLLSEDEVILRGKPVLQRGSSTVEGADDYTVFYMFGSKLRVIGMHRLINPGQMMASTDASGLPTLGAWTDSPNPLLPPLTESDVPAQVRAELQRAAEAEMLHQKTRAEFGPATPEPPPQAPTQNEQKPSDKKKAKS